jgi:hypothetical protein
MDRETEDAKAVNQSSICNFVVVSQKPSEKKTNSRVDIFRCSPRMKAIIVYYSLKHVLINCVYVAYIRQTVYNINTLSDLYTNAGRQKYR